MLACYTKVSSSRDKGPHIVDREVNAVTCKVTHTDASVCVVDDGQLLIAHKLDSAEVVGWTRGGGGGVDLLQLN